MHKWLLTVTVLFGCQTIPYDEAPIFSANENRYFSDCRGEGGGFFVTADKGQANFRARFDWIAQAKGSFEAEVSDILGRRLGRLQVANNEFRARPFQMRRSIRILEDGFLEIDGHFVPLKVDEIPCILGFVFPRDWKDAFVGQKRSVDRTVYFSFDKYRKLEVSLSKVPSAVNDSCATLSWSSFLGLISHRLRWCYFGAHHPFKGEIRFSDDAFIQWEEEPEAPRR